MIPNRVIILGLVNSPFLNTQMDITRYKCSLIKFFSLDFTCKRSESFWYRGVLIDSTVSWTTRSLTVRYPIMHTWNPHFRRMFMFFSKPNHQKSKKIVIWDPSPRIFDIRRTNVSFTFDLPVGLFHKQIIGQKISCHKLSASMAIVEYVIVYATEVSTVSPYSVQCKNKKTNGRVCRTLRPKD